MSGRRCGKTVDTDIIAATGFHELAWARCRLFEGGAVVGGD